MRENKITYLKQKNIPLVDAERAGRGVGRCRAAADAERAGRGVCVCCVYMLSE